MSTTELSSKDEAILLAHLTRLQDAMTEFCETAEETLGPYALPWTLKFRRVLDAEDETTQEEQLLWHENHLTEFGDLVLIRCMHCGKRNSFGLTNQGVCANCGWPNKSSKTLN